MSNTEMFICPQIIEQYFKYLKKESPLKHWSIKQQKDHSKNNLDYLHVS